MNGVSSVGRHGTAPRAPKRIGPVKPVQQATMSAYEYHQRYGSPTKDLKRVNTGKNNQQNGKLFEEILEAACEKYADEKVARVSKATEPFRIIGVLSNQPKVYKCVEAAKAEADFKGIMASGRAVTFEAKTTEQDRIEWGVVKEHQRQHLENYFNMNGLVFVMVSFGFQKFFRVPWWVWRDMKALYGRKYLKPDDMPEFEVPLVAYYKNPAVLFLDNIEEFPEAGEEDDAT